MPKEETILRLRVLNLGKSTIFLVSYAILLDSKAPFY